MLDPADLLVGVVILVPFRPLLEDAQDARFGGFPVNSLVAFSVVGSGAPAIHLAVYFSWMSRRV